MDSLLINQSIKKVVDTEQVLTKSAAKDNEAENASIQES